MPNCQSPIKAAAAAGSPSVCVLEQTLAPAEPDTFALWFNGLQSWNLRMDSCGVRFAVLLNVLKCSSSLLNYSHSDLYFSIRHKMPSDHGFV